MDIMDELEKYIKNNPNLLNNEEKQKARLQLVNFAKNPNQPVHDILLEFFIYKGIVPSDEDKFLEYVIRNYPQDKFPRVLEVATGKVCSLAQKLKQHGYRVTAMDPDIRIKLSDQRVKGIKMLKRKFTPDFTTSQYDFILGYNACPIAGTLLNVKNKPVVFTICDGPETDGKLDIDMDINSKKEFVDELAKRGGRIQYINDLTIIDNSRILQINKSSENQNER